eukprot:SAG25_NODE_112_length_14924_cov_13.606476_4_plen_577_part_00
MANAIGPGAQIRLDGKHNGHCRYKGVIDGRRGLWLGLEMDDTVGDNDGSIDGKSYFETHDGQGLFVRENSGRCMILNTGLADIPPEMLEHMEFLFEAFDTDNSGGIDKDELYTAMKNLGQKTTPAQVQAIFDGIDIDGSGSIDFHEFIEVMQVQWKGMDLSKVVEHLKEEQERERLRNAPGGLDSIPDDVPLVVSIGPIELNLRYFGAYTNLFLFVVYACFALAVVFHQFLTVPEDLMNVLLVASFGGMSTLFVVGGYMIQKHKWVAIKIYALLMFCGAGCQFAMCFLWFNGFFDVTHFTTISVMDRECGTCLASDQETCKENKKDLVIEDMPWFCCCHLHRCDQAAGSSPTQELVTAAACVDGCQFAPRNFTGMTGQALEQERIKKCQDQSRKLSTSTKRMADLCIYDATTVSCTKVEKTSCASYVSSPTRCESEHKGVCTYVPAVYRNVTVGGRGALSATELTEKDHCDGKGGFESHVANYGLMGKPSVLGGDKCFMEENYQTCMNEWQSNNQLVYVIVIFVMFPFQLLAAYVGWVMPELYMKAQVANSEDAAYSAHDKTTDNPMHEDTETEDT